MLESRIVCDKSVLLSLRRNRAWVVSGANNWLLGTREREWWDLEEVQLGDVCMQHTRSDAALIGRPTEMGVILYIVRHFTRSDVSESEACATVVNLMRDRGIYRGVQCPHSAHERYLPPR